MTYSLTQNSARAELNQEAKLLLNTQGVVDPISRQNFDNLEKFLRKFVRGDFPQKANIVYSPAFATQAPIAFTGVNTFSPGQLQVQIATRGNPVRIKVAPFQFSTGFPSFLKLKSLSTNATSAVFTWKRKDENGNVTIISQKEQGIQVTPAAGTQAIVAQFFQLPFFEFDDSVPTGVYTYQFLFTLSSSSQTITFQNVQVVAYELR